MFTPTDSPIQMFLSVFKVLAVTHAAIIFECGSFLIWTLLSKLLVRFWF